MARIFDTVVFVDRGRVPVPAGRLTAVADGERSHATFHYDPAYLARPDALAVDPVSLPLPDDPSRVFRTAPDLSLFGAVRDAGPDAWGRRLHDLAAGRPLADVEHVLAAGPDHVGALSFGPDRSGPRRTLPWTEDAPVDDLPTLVRDAEAAQAEDVSPATVRRLVLAGSALGGARPKLAITVGGVPWVAKLARLDDPVDLVRGEHAVMSLARAAGLDVPDLDLVVVHGRPVHLIRRFDRTSDGRRLPFASGLTALAVHERESPRRSYRDLADVLRRLSPDPAADLRELFGRVVLHVLVRNHDDHLRNHGLLADDDGGWRLSPAYDVTPLPGPTVDGELALALGPDGRRATLANALGGRAVFGLTRAAARAQIEQLRSVVAGWREAFHRAGMAEAAIARFETCFRALDEPT
jgi:serine/threonine-protein kinase HipA